MVVDDNPTLRMVVSAWIDHIDGMCVVGSAGDGAAALEECARCRPDVVLMDVEMPRMDGPEATRRLTERFPDVRVLAHTGHVETGPVTRMIVAGAIGYAVKGDDPSKLEQAICAAQKGQVQIDRAALPGLFKGVLQLAREELRRRHETERLAHELEQTFSETVRALGSALDKRDQATQEHVDRVTRWSVAVGAKLGLRGKELRDLEYGAAFHDVGKIGVPDSILKSSRRLNDDEWRIIKLHTIYGEQIIRPVQFLQDVAPIVRHSHEDFDGTGYPDGLAGEEIPLGARVVHACDAFDVMTQGRSYQQAFSYAVALRRMRSEAGTAFDPRVVDALERVLVDEGVLGPADLERAAEGASA